MKSGNILTILLIAFTAIIVNTIITEPEFKSLNDKALNALASNQPKLAESIYQEILAKNRTDIENNRNYIDSHFAIPEVKKISNNHYEYRDDKTILEYYTQLQNEQDTILIDLANYCLGLLYVNMEKPDKGLEFYKLVKNQNLKFLNNSIGYVYLKENQFRQAEKYFIKEISCKGNLYAAYSNLCKAYQKENNYTEIGKLINSSASEYIPANIKEEYFFRDNDFIQYYKVYFKTFSGRLNIWGFIAALAILIVWVIFLVMLDIYEKEKWYYILLAVFLGMACTFLTNLLYEFYSAYLGFMLNGDMFNDFFYCWFGIGLIEEIIKIIPFLILLRFTKIINESYDYILYASLSALGFAFIENLLYFDSNQLHIIHGRALASSVGHMFFSSIIAYGILINTFKWKENRFIVFTGFLLIAAFTHGFYDFWLINKSANSFSIITVFLLLASVFIWNYFVTNALNNSCFYDKDKKYKHEDFKGFLLIGLTSIFLLEYLIMSIKYGPVAGNSAFLNSAISGSYLLIFFAMRLGQLNIKVGQWTPFGYKSVFKVIDNDETLDIALDLEFEIETYTMNPIAGLYLPNECKIIKRLTVSGEQDWYLIELKEKANINSYDPSFLLIRTRDKRIKIAEKKKYIVDGYAIDNMHKLEKPVLQRTDFKHLNWLVLK